MSGSQEKPGTQVQVTDHLAVIQSGKRAINGSDAPAKRCFLPGQKTEKQNAGAGKPAAQGMDDSGNPLSDFGICAIAGWVVEVVCPDQQDDKPGMQTIQLALTDAPQGLPGSIAADAVVGSFQGSIMRVPNIAALLSRPFQSKRIAKKNDGGRAMS